MNPRLMDEKHLRVATRRSDRGAAQVALASLFAALLLLGVAQRGTYPSAFGADAAAAPSPAASPMAGVTTIRNTAVPAPPPPLGARPPHHQGGLYTYAGAAQSTADATALFGFYLDAMPGQGWTLLGKGDPTRSGWSQRWQAGTDAALLTMATHPRTTFTVQLCPPDPYC